MNEHILSGIYNMEQKRAQSAFDKVKETPEYKSAAEKFPAMLINCGLLQTLAFYKVKEKEFYGHVEEYFREVAGPFQLPTGKSLVKHVAYLSNLNYRAATVEALSFSTWLKRFAEARYQEEKEKAKSLAKDTDK